jgi:hypothetical protein
MAADFNFSTNRIPYMQETNLPLVVQHKAYKSNDNFVQDQTLDKHEIVLVNKF